jgi:hypothetical protein
MMHYEVSAQVSFPARHSESAPNNAMPAAFLFIESLTDHAPVAACALQPPSPNAVQDL